MQASKFVKGSKVCSPYASGSHYANPARGRETTVNADQIGIVGDVESDGWATVAYSNGYTVTLNAERCILIAEPVGFVWECGHPMTESHLYDTCPVCAGLVTL